MPPLAEDPTQPKLAKTTRTRAMQNLPYHTAPFFHTHAPSCSQSVPTAERLEPARPQPFFAPSSLVYSGFCGWRAGPVPVPVPTVREREREPLEAFWSLIEFRDLSNGQSHRSAARTCLCV